MRSRTSREQKFRWAAIHLLLGLLVSTGLLQPLSAQPACDSGKEKTLADSEVTRKEAPPVSLALRVAATSPVVEESREPEAKSVPSASKLKALLRAQVLMVGVNAPASSALAFNPKEVARYRAPSLPQSGTGKKVKKGSLIVGLIGLGLLGSGAYLFATYEQPRTLVGLLDEEPTNRRAMGSAMMGLGATLAAIGFLSMR